MIQQPCFFNITLIMKPLQWTELKFYLALKHNRVWSESIHSYYRVSVKGDNLHQGR